MIHFSFLLRFALWWFDPFSIRLSCCLLAEGNLCVTANIYAKCLNGYFFAILQKLPDKRTQRLWMNSGCLLCCEASFQDHLLIGSNQLLLVNAKLGSKGSLDQSFAAILHQPSKSLDPLLGLCCSRRKRA